MTEITFREFGASAAPWLPDQPFWQQNADTLRTLNQQITHDYPHTREALQFDPASPTLPFETQRRELWAIMMGRQHGGQQAEDQQKVLIPYGKQPYMDLLQPLRWGGLRFMGRNAIDTAVSYDQVFSNCGTAVEHAAMAEEMAPGGKLLDNVQGVTWLSGQRLRGTFDVVGEDCSPKELVDIVGEWTGRDMDRLVQKSARLRDQLARRGDDWGRPFGNEADIVELNTLAHFADHIDWRADVEVVPPVGENEPIVYRKSSGEETVMPSREYARLSYPLRDGRKVHIINGPAVPRTLGDPRATSSSIAQDAPNYITLPENSQLVGMSLAPHVRGPADTAISFLDAARRGMLPSIGRFDLANGAWCVESTAFATAALGEIMATMKADYRLRAVLRGQDPNAPELTAI